MTQNKIEALKFQNLFATMASFDNPTSEPEAR